MNLCIATLFALTISNFEIHGIKGNGLGNNSNSSSNDKHDYSMSAAHCREGWVRYRREKCFKLFSLDHNSTTSMNFTEAEQFCGRDGAHLASVHSEDELRFIKSYLIREGAIDEPVWVGGNRKDGGRWTWSDSSAFNESWDSGHPKANQNCTSVVVSSQGATNSKYGSQHCHVKLKYLVCQEYQLEARRMQVVSNRECQTGHLSPVASTTTTKSALNGWIVIQRRGSKLGSGQVRQDFNLTWSEYENGFGNLTSDFWLGLKNIAELTNNGNYELRIEMKDFKGSKTFANYAVFQIDAHWVYQLNLGGYSGNAGDGLSYDNGTKFSTKDRDNDLDSSLNCASYFGGAWWHKDCSDVNGFCRVNLNGIYYEKERRTNEAIRWWTATSDVHLAFIEMKIRRRCED